MCACRSGIRKPWKPCRRETRGRGRRRYGDRRLPRPRVSRRHGFPGLRIPERQAHMKNHVIKRENQLNYVA